MNKQPSFFKFLPVSLMVAAVAAIVVYGCLAFAPTYPWMGAVWVIFISWAMYFAYGAKLSRMHKFVLGLTAGLVAGWVTLAVLDYATRMVGGALALPVTVFFIALIIVQLELSDWLELAPAYFFSYAAYFAFVFGGFDKGASNELQGVHIWVLLMAGLALGWLVAWLRRSIMNIERVPLDMRNTVFDKER